MTAPLRKGPSGPVADPASIEDHKVLVDLADTTPGFLASKFAAGANVVLTILVPGGDEKIEVGVPTNGLYPVADNVFALRDDVDPTKFLNVELAGQSAGTTQTIVTAATASRPFRLPDISGTAAVVQDVTGKVYLGLGVTSDVVSSNAGIQYSTLVANRSQLRANQFGANSSGPGATGFKSRGLTLGAFAGCIGGDILYRITAIGVTPNSADIPLAGTLSIQVPPAFVAAAQNYLPTEYEVALVSLAGPINSRRPVQLVTSEGETQTLRGVRAGGSSTLPTVLGTGALWSSDAGDPNAILVPGTIGDLFSNTAGGAGTTLWVKEAGAPNSTGGWAPK